MALPLIETKVRMDPDQQRARLWVRRYGRRGWTYVATYASRPLAEQAGEKLHEIAAEQKRQTQKDEADD